MYPKHTSFQLGDSATPPRRTPNQPTHGHEDSHESKQASYHPSTLPSSSYRPFYTPASSIEMIEQSAMEVEAQRTTALLSHIADLRELLKDQIDKATGEERGGGTAASGLNLPLLMPRANDLHRLALPSQYPQSFTINCRTPWTRTKCTLISSQLSTLLPPQTGCLTLLVRSLRRSFRVNKQASTSSTTRVMRSSLEGATPQSRRPTSSSMLLTQSFLTIWTHQTPSLPPSTRRHLLPAPPSTIRCSAGWSTTVDALSVFFKSATTSQSSSTAKRR